MKGQKEKGTGEQVKITIKTSNYSRNRTLNISDSNLAFILLKTFWIRKSENLQIKILKKMKTRLPWIFKQSKRETNNQYKIGI